MSIKSLALAIFLGWMFLNVACANVVFVDAAPTQRVAGVRVGQRIKYGGFLSLWASEVPDASPTLDLLDVNATDWVVNTVRNVSGSVVTFEISTRYKNGSEVSSIADVNVDTGVGRGNMSFVTAGIAAGDRVYTAGELYAARVNSTSLWSFAGVFRETSVLNVTESSVDLDTASAYWSEFFWDKLTGALVRQFWSTAYLDKDGYLTLASVEYEMVDNNVWLGESARVSDAVPPVASAGSDVSVEVGVAASFDGGGSRDDVGIIGFAWDFGDGSSSVGITASHVYDKAGSYNVTLTVEDVGGNRASDVLLVTVVAGSGGSFVVPPWVVPVGGLAVLVVSLVLVWLFFRRR